MRMTKLAFLNFKGSFRNYLSLVLSLSFTLMIFLNFQNMICCDAFQELGERNRNYVNIVVQAVSFVLGCFMFFFVWYATNVFLGNRKKQIGIYAFMGLSNQKIGKMYLIETLLIGLAALILGISLGIVTTGLFLMIVLAISDLSVDVFFLTAPGPIFTTAAVYLAIYLIFSLKGYFNIVQSSVLSMISAARQNEYVRQKPVVLAVKAVLGTGILGTGYYMAFQTDGQLLAVILVTLGVYLLFGGLIPLIFQSLAHNKRFLYRRQRNLWINSVIFRMRKNYRTYAIACVLALCSATALAASFSFKLRYDERRHFQNTYTFQIIGYRPGLGEEAAELIQERSAIAYHSEVSVLSLEGVPNYGILSYSGLRLLAEAAGLKCDLTEPADDEIIVTAHLPLLSLIMEDEMVELELGGKVYVQTQSTVEPYMGRLQDYLDFCIVNDSEYARLRLLGDELYAYNYRIEDPSAFSEIKESLSRLGQSDGDGYVGRISVDPNNSDTDWIKVMYALGIFMFLVFILASGCIMFMKLYNDAFEERERYSILRKLGIEEAVLTRAVVRELGTAYGVPFLVMMVSSCFSVHALEEMMHTRLYMVNAVSVAVVFMIFLLFYILSVTVYKKLIKDF